MTWIEAVKAHQAEVEDRIFRNGKEMTDVGIWLAIITHLPAAIELVEEQHRVLCRILDSLEVCPWCLRSMETGRSGHADNCDLDAVLEKVRKAT